MSEKIGEDVIKKRSKRKLRKAVEKANQIGIQILALEELGKRRMTSKELRQYIESLGGDYSSILPILKNSGLIEAKSVNTGRRGRTYFYSLNE